MPQGGPLSPLLSNIIPFIEGKLFLKVNRNKTNISHISKVKTKFKELKRLGVDEEKVWICANIRKGNWYRSRNFIIQRAFDNNKLHELGYPTFTEFYLKICEN